jgi:hypothetical protein
MINYTCEQLQAAIGRNLMLVPLACTQKASIQGRDAEEYAVIDFKKRCMEARLTVIWDEKDVEAMPNGMPDTKAIAVARQELVEELLDDWNRAGFTVSAEGAIERHPISNQPDREQPVYVVLATKSVQTLVDAVETLRWFRPGRCETRALASGGQS